MSVLQRGDDEFAPLAQETDKLCGEAFVECNFIVVESVEVSFSRRLDALFPIEKFRREAGCDIFVSDGSSEDTWLAPTTIGCKKISAFASELSRFSRAVISPTTRPKVTTITRR